MSIAIDSSALHPSTRLALEALEWLNGSVAPPANILDIGCGNGILSLTAAHIWGAKVLACDISPRAVADTQANIASFAPDAAIQVIRSDGPKHPAIKAAAPYDLIIGNLLAEWQVQMAREMASLLTAGGYILLSGILLWQAEGIKAAFDSLNINIIHEVAEAEWLCYIGCHNICSSLPPS